MPQGQIKTLKNGFGYIVTANIPHQELFFHVSALEDMEFKDLKVGETVEYELEDNTSNLIQTLRKVKI